MNTIFADYLNKFKDALLGEEGFKDSVCEIVKEKSGFEISREAVALRNNNICLNCDPYLKTEIGFHKEGILESLRQKYPTKKLSDII